MIKRITGTLDDKGVWTIDITPTDADNAVTMRDFGKFFRALKHAYGVYRRQNVRLAYRRTQQEQIQKQQVVASPVVTVTQKI